MTTMTTSASKRNGIPRGLARTGPVLFSYGFRPFFLGGALWAIAAMGLWIGTVTGVMTFAEEYGPHHWHAHEMLFGYSSAVLAGFLLTAVPNWTGRLPVSGWPLFFLFLLWLSGRLVFLVSERTGITAAVAVDALFLPALLLICVREVVAGRKWKDLKVITGLAALSVANLVFHYEVVAGEHPDFAYRLAIAAYVGLIMVIGGRIIPSFTRNWINGRGRTDFPTTFNSFDSGCIAVGVLALGLWVTAPDLQVTALAALTGAVLHAVRLWRWRGWTTFAEMLVAILHVAYLFVPLGFIAIALASIDIVDPTSALHVMTIGTVASMMIAVMTRASRGHTGRALTASKVTRMSYAAIVACALARPATALVPEFTQTIYAVSGVLWLCAFGLFVIEYGPMLVLARRKI